VPATELAPHTTHLLSAARTGDSPTLGPIGPTFGGITVIAGLIATLLGSILADRLRPSIPSSDFLVAGTGALLAVPAYLGFLFTPFPYAWGWLFVTIFFLFLNTGPVNAITANVTSPFIRANAYALSILVMHALGDVISPPIIGWLTDRYDWTTALLAVSGVLVASGVFWLAGMSFLVRDVEQADGRVLGLSATKEPV
jgi:MFS family permease